MSTPCQVYRPYRPCQAISCNVLALSIKQAHSKGYVGHDATVTDKSKSTRVPAVEGWWQRLAWLQRSSKLSQSEFADAIDITQGMFSKWVNNKISSGPNATSLYGIVAFFGIPRRHWVTEFVLQNKCVEELEDFMVKWDPGPSRQIGQSGLDVDNTDFLDAIEDIAGKLARVCKQARASPDEEAKA